MTRKGRLNNKGIIQYPRKCDQCDYMSNNPVMYHYHKHTHDPILAGTLCDLGCGQMAIVRGTGGKYTCQTVAHHCPEYLKKLSIQIKKQWDCPESIKRKERTRESFIKRVHNQETYSKSKNTKRQKFRIITPEQIKDYRHYARKIRSRAQQWAREQGYKIGKQTLHVDHKLSILDAWHANLPAEIVNHPVNLQILEAKKNSSKGSRSSITVEELMKNINEYS